MKREVLERLIETLPEAAPGGHECKRGKTMPKDLIAAAFHRYEFNEMTPTDAAESLLAELDAAGYFIVKKEPPQ